MGSGNPLAMLSPDSVIQFMLGASGAQPVFRFGTMVDDPQRRRGCTAACCTSSSTCSGSASSGRRRPTSMVRAGWSSSTPLPAQSGFTVSSLGGYFMGWMPIPFLRGAAMTVGASAAIFGLLGALVYYGRRGGSSHHPNAKRWVTPSRSASWVSSCRGVDNYAHGGGFLGGYLAGIWLDPLKPERMDHLVDRRALPDC